MISGYLTDLRTGFSPDNKQPGEIGNTLDFQFNPRELTRGVESTYATHPIPGRSHAAVQDGTLGKRTWGMKLFWLRDDAASDATFVKVRYRWLESLLTLAYDDSGVQTAGKAICLFSFGDFINERVVLEAFAPKFSIFTPDRLLPMKMEVDITLMEVPETSWDFRDLRR